MAPVKVPEIPPDILAVCNATITVIPLSWTLKAEAIAVAKQCDVQNHILEINWSGEWDQFKFALSAGVLKPEDAPQPPRTFQVVFDEPDEVVTAKIGEGDSEREVRLMHPAPRQTGPRLPVGKIPANLLPGFPHAPIKAS
jgi:hypothetical protein